MNKQIKLCAVAATFFMGGFCASAQAKVFNVDANSHSVSVAGRAAGLNTGVTVKPGNLLVINASKQDTWALGAAQHTSNANGLGNPIGLKVPNFTLRGTSFSFLPGTLVGSLDNGLTFFPIGTRMEQTITKNGGGTLKLYTWDSDNANNSGTIAVDVDVYTAP